MNIVHFVLSFKYNTSGYGNGRDGLWHINYAHIQHVDSEWKLIILPTSHVAPIKPAAHVHVKKPRPSTHVPPFRHGLLRHVPVSISTLKRVSTSYDKLSLVKEISDKGLRDTYMSHYALHGHISCVMIVYNV